MGENEEKIILPKDRPGYVPKGFYREKDGPQKVENVSLKEIEDVEKTIDIPLEELVVEDVSDKKIEQRARAFIMGSEAIGRRKEVRELLEERVIQRVGKKGKHITDKLFELIEGVYMVEKS